MIKTCFKVGETVTIKPTTQAGTQYRYALAHLSGGAILIEEKDEKAEQLGGVTAQAFTFKFINPGEVEIQFACYHDDKDVFYEDKLMYFAYVLEQKSVTENSNVTTHMGETICNADDGYVYFVQHDEFNSEKKRMYIRTWDSYLKVFRRIHSDEVPGEIIKLIPEMEELDRIRVGLFIGEQTGRYYFCTGRKRYYIPNQTVIDGVGFDTSKAKKIPDCMIEESFPVFAGDVLYQG